MWLFIKHGLSSMVEINTLLRFISSQEFSRGVRVIKVALKKGFTLHAYHST